VLSAVVMVALFVMTERRLRTAPVVAAAA